MRSKTLKATCSCGLKFVLPFNYPSGDKEKTEAVAKQNLQKAIEDCKKRHPEEQLQLKRRNKERIQRLYSHILGDMPYYNAKDYLTEKEWTILNLRYGISEDIDSEPCTLEEVARKFGVTRERIRQIEAKAMEKMRVNINKINL